MKFKQFLFFALLSTLMASSSSCMVEQQATASHAQDFAPKVYFSAQDMLAVIAQAESLKNLRELEVEQAEKQTIEELTCVTIEQLRIALYITERTFTQPKRYLDETRTLITGTDIPEQDHTCWSIRKKSFYDQALAAETHRELLKQLVDYKRYSTAQIEWSVILHCAYDKVIEVPDKRELCFAEQLELLYVEMCKIAHFLADIGIYKAELLSPEAFALLDDENQLKTVKNLLIYHTKLFDLHFSSCLFEFELSKEKNAHFETLRKLLIAQKFITHAPLDRYMLIKYRKPTTHAQAELAETAASHEECKKAAAASLS